MKKQWTFKNLEEYGRVRLSPNFYMREFLHSEIAQVYGLVNAPCDPDLAIQSGSRLCEDVLEPISAAWGKMHIRSGYRSPEVNRLGNERKLNCAGNKANAAAHIWDELDEHGNRGASACIVIPRFQDYYEETSDWPALAWWIHENIPDYFEMCFFKQQCALNIRWYESGEAAKTIKSFVVNPETGNKKNLITNGVVPGEYSKARIAACVGRATKIMTEHT